MSAQPSAANWVAKVLAAPLPQGGLVRLVQVEEV
jgi:hypothetical protein